MKPDLSFRIHNAAVTALALVCTYALAFYWELDKPFWAGFTVFMISLPSIGQSLQKGVLRTFGTLMGALLALLLLMLFPQERFLLLMALSLCIGLMLFFMSASAAYGYFFFMSCVVTVIIVLMGARDPLNAFHLSVYRTEETLLGIGVYTLVTLVFAPQTSVDTLYRNMRTLTRGHAELFAMNSGDARVMGRLYVAYHELHALASSTGLLVPAVRLESYQIYHNKAFWERAIWCSEALLETQRKWTGTLVALKDLDMESLFPGFASKIEALGRIYATIATIGTDSESVPPLGELPTLNEAAPLSELESTRQSLALAAQRLFREQVDYCAELHGLLAHLLAGREAPPLIAEKPRSIAPLITPDQVLNIAQALVIFWSVTLLWIFLDPPGTESVAFLELTVILGLSFLLTGQDKPLVQILLFALGSVCAGGLYVFVTPLITDVAVFMVLMFAFGFMIMFLFPSREQNFAKYAFMMPWLSIGNFTNTPSYSFIGLVTGLFVLLLGISLISLIHYVFFTRNHETLFFQKQAAFFVSTAKMLDLLRRTQGKATPVIYRLRLLWRMHRTRYLADQILSLTPKLSEDFVKPELLQLFGMEIRDSVLAMHGLHERLLLLDHALAFPSPETVPGKDLWANVENVRNRTRALLEGIRSPETLRFAYCSVEDAERLAVLCGNIMKALANTLDVLQSFPEEREAWNVF